MKKKKDCYQVLARNRRAFHEFNIEQTYEAGIKLLGSEVKSMRERNPSIAEAYVKLIGGEVFLVGAHVPEFKQASIFNHEPTRKRKLLLQKSQIKSLRKQLELKGYTLVPLKIYFNARNMVKVEIGLGKGKKLYDKRQDLKKKTDEKRKNYF